MPKKQIKKEPEEKSEKKILEKENQQLKKFFIAMGLIVVIFIGGFIAFSYSKTIEYQEIKFKPVQEGNLIFYNTVLEIYTSKGHVADYNVYFRTSPKDLKDIPFAGNMELKKDLVITSEKNFECKGDEIIAVANLVKSLKAMGINSVKNETLGCDAYGRYMFINIKPSNETSVKQTGPLCYDINIKECEILQGTEKFLVESIKKYNELMSAYASYFE